MTVSSDSRRPAVRREVLDLEVALAGGQQAGEVRFDLTAEVVATSRGGAEVLLQGDPGSLAQGVLAQGLGGVDQLPAAQHGLGGEGALLMPRQGIARPAEHPPCQDQYGADNQRRGEKAQLGTDAESHTSLLRQHPRRQKLVGLWLSYHVPPYPALAKPRNCLQ